MDIVLTFGSIIISSILTWYFSKYYYDRSTKRSENDLNRLQESIKEIAHQFGISEVSNSKKGIDLIQNSLNIEGQEKITLVGVPKRKLNWGPYPLNEEERKEFQRLWEKLLIWSKGPH